MPAMHIPTEDLRALRQDKYGNDPDADMSEDLKRLAEGEPLAYVIGWVPFLGLRIHLDSRPLIPRPETEWWTEKLITHLRERFGDEPFTLLDLCAGSGATGLAVLRACPKAQVSFGEQDPEHTELIRKNLEANGLDASRATIRTSDLFAAFTGERFDVVATNPPYIPDSRELPDSVTGYEPALALYGGVDGLAMIRKIVEEAPGHLRPSGEVWMECDIENIVEAESLLEKTAQKVEVWTDPYGRARLLVSYYPS